MRKNSQKGIGLVEIMIGAAIILSIVSILVAVNNMYLKVTSSSIRSVKADLLLQEGVEAIRLIRDGGWTNNIAGLSINTPYYYFFDTNNNKWSATTTPIYVDGMKRTFTLSNVYRDANSDIVTSGTLDSGSRKVVVEVDWFGYSATSTATLTTYIDNVSKD